ncbi:hypothetical protein BBBOND_0303510 [Babesia bigemina]|uniref:C3H1-type domain-containing protein n=1 Tax=Babesia bigemina TaxID=5866 RepID=A0A061D8Z8_BABBI|nr:hypothetical protein BBBOND_0303510 [Babesia bigemina]CDR96447.1 hypothetical protein BBBOND_0303510 [Babesia bigemina]|eukprot:XP_012768633.1 hypothetical protein BBBOND_0303510 [Babesia bigemina]
MAPKKLTDCPENLREAIDWLIQVKNGGNGSGLDKLGNALKILIGEAIQKAKDSNKHTADKLRCAKNDTYDRPYCKELDERIAKANVELKISKSVQNFDKTSRDSLSADIKRFESQKADCVKSHYMDDQGMNDIQNKISQADEVISKLGNVSKELTNEDNTNILWRLCDGIEAFLGYAAGNYTGNGIVYGDCDRLRDAVLMFLNGVLVTVKDDENFRTYVLNGGDISKLVENKSGNGRTEFNLVISSVRSMLSLWDEMLTARTNKILYDIESFKDGIEHCYHNIDKQQGKGCMAMHASFMRSVEMLNRTISEIRCKNDGYAGVDKNLRSKLDVPFGYIDEGVNMLINSANNDGLIKAVEMIQNMFNTLPDELENFIRERVISTISDHSDHVEELKKYINMQIDNYRNRFVQERLSVVTRDLEMAVVTFSKNAYNQGGLKNVEVGNAINVIQQMLENVDNNVKDEVTLNAQNADTQIALIKKALNTKSQLGFTDALNGLSEAVGDPGEIFNEKHKNDLKAIVIKAQTDLKQAASRAEENAKNLGGLRNVKVAEAIQVIQQNLGRADRVTNMELLINLKKDIMDHQVRHIMDALNPDKPLPGVVKRLQSLNSIIEEPQQIFDRDHRNRLEELVAATEKEFLGALNQAQLYTTCTNFGLKKKVDEIFELVLKNVKSGKILISEIKSSITPALKKIGEGITENFQSGSNNISSKLRTLETSIANAIESNFERKLVTEITEHDFNGWFHSYMSHVLKEANEVISKADKAYQLVSEQLGMISSAVKHIKQKAESGTLNSVISGLEIQFAPIYLSIDTSSFYEDDRKSRRAYFDDLKSHLKNTLNILQVAYNNGYQSAAKTYLSEAISKIKAAVEEAERQYGDAVVSDISSIKSKLNKIVGDVFTKSDQREALQTLFDRDFDSLEDKVTSNSAFNDDYIARKQCFESLKALIKDAVENLSIIYKEAYQSSANTYLSRVIKAIEDKVKEAEGTYALAVHIELEKVKEKFKEITEENIKDKESKYEENQDRKKKHTLGTLFDKPFQDLQTAVLKHSAFKKDADCRKMCFEHLRALINNTVKTLIKAAKTHDTCALKAEEYLGKAFEDAKGKINTLGDSVKHKVKEACDRVIAEVCAMQAAHHKADLAALKSLVQKQRDNIFNIVNEDLKTGIKGFLQILKRWFDIKSDQLTTVQDLNRLSGEFKDLYDNLYSYVKFQHDGLEVEVDSEEDASQPQTQVPPLQAVPTPMASGGYKARPAMAAVTSQTHGKSQGKPELQNSGRAGYLRPVKRADKSVSKDTIATYLVGLEYHSRKLYNALTVGNFTHQSANICHDFAKFLESMRPLMFGRQDNPLLDIIKSGLKSFLAELGKAYISTYCGAAHMYDWNLNGRNCAKVFMTLLEILKTDFDELHEKCGENGVWNNKTICVLAGSNSYNDLGLCLKRFGYGVPSKDGKQDNELQCKSNMNGNEIFTKLVQQTVTVKDDYTLMTTIENLSKCLATYYRVRHYSTLQSKTYPLSVYQMLNWLSGFPNNPAYDELTLNGFSALFDKPDEEAADDTNEGVIAVAGDAAENSMHDLPFKFADDDVLEAYPENITPTTLRDTLAAVCANSHNVLTSILGHGHSNGIYACEFNTNSLSLWYPADTNSLVCMLFDILKRIHHQLYILYHQCSYETDLGGWRDCWYGRDVGGSDWRCNRLQCAGQMGDQKHNQTCDQKCNQSAGCGLKSPLQSYLEDGLQGYLPHQIKYEKGKVDCALKDHSGGPCKSPIGFPDISVTASHRYIGKHIHVALASLFGEKSSPLSQLCAQLNCLLPSAPKTLDDMFGFYLNFIGGWSRKQKTAFEQTVRDANFKRTNATLDICPVFESIEHKPAKPPGQKNSHITGDLYSLVKCRYNESSTVAHPCGPYLRPSCYYASGIFADKHNDKYLSWIVYLTETFHRLLKQLYEECNGNCGGERPKCRISKCVEKCAATTSPLSPESTHKASCKSIVHCKYTRPTFYKFGFIFRDCKILSDQSSRRTCQDFCTALNHVINDKETVGAALAKLIYVTIPEYLLEIRKPFMLLTLTLWLLSLLYLLHIMVIRLDLLHIKSHLRSPSSHRIAAQSLLAAARVGKLAQITYLQP